MGPHHERLFAWLQASTVMVPTTGRSLEAFRRLHLPFAHGAICAHGAMILRPDGTLEPEWRAQVADHARSTAALLEALRSELGAWLEARRSPIRMRVVDDDGVPLYLAFRDPGHEPAERTKVSAKIAALRPPDWLIHDNGAHLALLPAWVRKSRGVAWVLENWFPDRLVLGFGDSLSDVEFFGLAHVGMVPVPSQAFAALWDAGEKASRGRPA